LVELVVVVDIAVDFHNLNLGPESDSVWSGLVAGEIVGFGLFDQKDQMPQDDSGHCPAG